jgi:hypothetical protein
VLDARSQKKLYYTTPPTAPTQRNGTSPLLRPFSRSPPRRSTAMSLVANAFLSDRSLKIRAKAIPWEVSLHSSRDSPPGPLTDPVVIAPHHLTSLARPRRGQQGYQRAGLLEPEDVKLVQRVASTSREKAESILDAVRFSCL